MGRDDKSAEEYIKELLAEQAQREADYIAIREEFKKTVVKDYSPEDVKEKIRELMAEAYGTLRELLDAEKETVRFQAAKYIFDIGIGQIKITDANDADKLFADLLTDLKKKNVPTEAPADSK
jgi:ribosomal protein RSM22 (predicted rRNA methylase)